MPDLSPFIGAGILALLLYFAVTAALVGASIWLIHTIIWRSVRRGLHEFYYPGTKLGTRPTQQVVAPPRDW